MGRQYRLYNALVATRRGPWPWSKWREVRETIIQVSEDGGRTWYGMSKFGLVEELNELTRLVEMRTRVDVDQLREKIEAALEEALR
jgi:hypothetical protein